MASLLELSDIPLSANTDPVGKQHIVYFNNMLAYSIKDYKKSGLPLRPVNLPLLLVLSLMTEEFREVKWGAGVVAVATERFILFCVAVRLQSGKK